MRKILAGLLEDRDICPTAIFVWYARFFIIRPAFYRVQMRTRIQASKIGRRKYVRETMNEVLMPADKAAENYEGQEDLSSEFGNRFYKHGFRRRVSLCTESMGINSTVFQRILSTITNLIMGCIM